MDNLHSKTLAKSKRDQNSNIIVKNSTGPSMIIGFDTVSTYDSNVSR